MNTASFHDDDKPLPRRWLMPWRRHRPTVPVLRLTGAIGTAPSLRPGLSLAGVAADLHRAFSVKGAKAVAIAINSPGGSPVQSHLIFKRIRALAEEKQLPVLVFMEDVAASGGYLIALAGDEIYADASSIVGSIGVIFSGFGFDKAIKKIGVDRRVYTAGKSKATLDPFQPAKKEEIERLKAIQTDMHRHFKDLVLSRRGKRLKGDEETLFNGEFWSGTKALELGLIDGLGDMRALLRDRYGDKVRLKVISRDRIWWRSRLPFARLVERLDADGGETKSGETWADDVLAALERRAIWARFGL